MIEVAYRFLGIAEVSGHTSNPQILAMLQLDDSSVQDDETPWCSAFVNYITWLFALPRSRSLAARSWLRVGDAIPLSSAREGDIVVLSRGPEPQPGPEVLDAPGHVGFLINADTQYVAVLGGNQGNKVSIATFPSSRILGVRAID